MTEQWISRLYPIVAGALRSKREAEIRMKVENRPTKAKWAARRDQFRTGNVYDVFRSTYSDVRVHISSCKLKLTI